MRRLTHVETNGKICIVGINEDNWKAKMHACICKLKDYENTGLEPDEVNRCVSPAMLNLMKHTIGFERRNVKRGRYRAYRNYFAAPPDGNRYLDRGVEMGLVLRHHNKESMGVTYVLTADGIYYLAKILDVKIYEDD